MQREELEAIFDQQAASYDQQWARLSPIRDGLHFLIGTVFSELPADARVLCVGAGTGAEMLYLAQRFPGWQFTVVEPSASMLQVSRQQADKHGVASRCIFHGGYLESLEPSAGFHAATSILVSQFTLEQDARAGFFRAIAERLLPGGYLVSADLAADIDSERYERLLEVWLRLMTISEVPSDVIARLRTTYSRDVAVLPPERVEAIIASGGFEMPVPLFQGGLIHAWFSRRTA